MAYMDSMLGYNPLGYNPQDEDFRQFSFPEPKPILGSANYQPPTPELGFADRMANAITRPAPGTYTADIPEDARRKNLWEALMMAGLKMGSNAGASYAGPPKPAWAGAIQSLSQIPLDTMQQYRELNAADVNQLKAKAEEQNKFLAAQAAGLSAQGQYMRGQGAIEQARRPQSFTPQYHPGIGAGGKPEWFTQQTPTGKLAPTGVQALPRTEGVQPQQKIDKKMFDSSWDTANKAYFGIGTMKAKSVDAAEQILRDVIAGKRTGLETESVNSFMAAMENLESNWPKEASKHPFYKEYKMYKEAAGRITSRKPSGGSHTGAIQIGAGK